jgi:hypothetical protein
MSINSTSVCQFQLSLNATVQTYCHWTLRCPCNSHDPLQTTILNHQKDQMNTGEKVSLPTLNNHDSQLYCHGTSDPFAGVPTAVRKFTKFTVTSTSSATPIQTSCLISGSSRELDDNCTLLDIYASSSGNFLATFRDSVSVPSSRVRTTYRSNLHGSGQPIGPIFMGQDNLSVQSSWVRTTYRSHIHGSGQPIGPIFMGQDNLSVQSSWVRTTYRSNLQGTKWPLKMESIGCPKSSLRNYHYSMRKVTEERSSRYRHQL